MRAHRSRHVLAAAGAGVALLLAGCSGGASADGADGDAEERTSPLSEYYDQIYAEQSPEEMDADTRERESIIAACMQEQGFEYTPMDPATDGSYVEEALEEEDLPPEDRYGTREYVATHGYDVATYDETAVEEEPVEEYVDPNEDYVSAMSESEQTAFYEALHGPPIEYDENAPEEEMTYDWTASGCYGRADHEMNGDQPYDDPQFASLNEDMEEMYESMSTSPAMAALNAEWASCMADAGYAGYRAKEDAYTDISDQMNALWEAAGETGEPDQAAVEELKQVELDTAMADFECSEEVGYEEESMTISHQVEQDFVDSHQAELEAMVAAHGQEP